MKSPISTLVLLASLLGCTSTPKADPTPVPPPLPSTIEEAVASNARSPENRKRDVYRHPAETLNFFGLRPDMTVIEVSPGAGWYMEILAPLLHTNGEYIAALPPSNGGEMTKLNEKVGQWIQKHPELSPKIKTVTMSPPKDLVPSGSADMVLTFRNVHNWLASGQAQDQFKSFFKALKAGGVLGVVEHRADPNMKDANGKSGYVTEAEVIRLATNAGFKLAAKSEINANPKDTKNYPEGVWTLPPSLRLKDKDREKYLAIGESDRMTLRFVKPAKK